MLIKRNFTHDYSNLSKYTLESKTITKCNGTTATANAIKELTKDFYSDLKTLLSLSELPITFDDTNYKFTIFGFEYTVLVTGIITSSAYLTIPTDNASCALITVPLVFSENSYSATQCFKTTFSTSSSTLSPASYTVPGAGGNTSLLVSLYDRNVSNYTIKLYYNTNYILVQYISSLGESNNLVFVMEGNLADDKSKKYVYETASPNNNYITTTEINSLLNGITTAYGSFAVPSATHQWNAGYHQIYDEETKNSIIPRTASNIPGPQNNLQLFGFNGLMMSRAKSIMIDYIKSTDYVISDPICMGGMINFENLMLGDSSMVTDKFYNINGETYYCPGDKISDCCESSGVNGLFFNKFLLKM